MGEGAGACVSSRIRDGDQLKSRLIEEWKHFHQVFTMVGWVSSVVERRSLIGELSLVCTGLAADG